MFKRKKALIFTFIFTACSMLFDLFFSLPAFAYFDRGAVSLMLGNSNITVEKGSSIAVSATLNPASRDELPSCGLPECPQTCGPECINETGDCTCNGYDYQTYYATVISASADANIATASYANGVLTIRGINTGTTTITTHGSLRQYSNSPEQVIHVTVTTPSPSAPSNNQSTPPANSGGSSTSPSTVQVLPPSTAAQNNNPPSSSSPTLPGSENQTSTSTQPGSTIKTSDGIVDLFPLRPNTLTGKDVLQSAKGSGRTVTFQDKDASGNILYSWSFKGKDITNPADIDMTIDFSSDYQDRIESMAKISDPTYFSFAHSGDLPGKATVNLSTQGNYQNDGSLYLYYYNEETDEISLIAQDLKVANGYVAFDITHCSDYFLTPSPITTKSNSSNFIFMVTGIIVLIAATTVFIVRRSKKHHLKV